MIPKDKDNIPAPSESIDDNLFKIKNYLKKFWVDVLDLEHGVDKLLTINEIKNKKSMSGPNAWMLICSIVIASVGLDMNSPAVIIGGMLISPLMSPILGMGLAIGINDKETLKKSLVHFGMAVLIALITSTIYFWLTPLGEMNGEIYARTEPGPLDIFIAFFGGIAGIVSIARKDISTTLPGVAIATALMPPVCVTGFGIANGLPDVALSSFFLLFINTVFVSFATYIIVKFVLRFPQRDFSDAAEKRKNTYYIAAFLFSVAFVSYFPFKKLLNKRETNQKIETLITEVFGEKRALYDGKEIYTKGDSSLIVLKCYGDGEQFIQKNGFDDLIKKLELKNTTVEIMPSSTINEGDLEELHNKIKGMQDMTSKVSQLNQQKAANDDAVNKLMSELETFRMNPKAFDRMTNVIKSVSPKISGVSYGKGQSNNFTEITNEIPVIIIDWVGKEEDQDRYETQIYNIVKSDLQVDSVKVAHIY